MKAWLLAAVALVAGVGAGAALLAGPDPQATPTADQMAARMMSPFCPGLTLDECPSGQAGALRAEVDRMADEGVTNEEFDRWVVDNFGEVALARPGGLAAWAVPPVIALAGLGVVLMVLRRRRDFDNRDPDNRDVVNRDLDAREVPGELSPEDDALFEQDFGRFRQGSE